MKIIIENGVTIIKTGDANGGVKNKHNQTGVSRYNSSSGAIQYKAEITVNRHKYYLGVRATVEEAAKLRLEAEKQLANGTFHEWLNEIKSFSPYTNLQKGVTARRQPTGTKYEAHFRINGNRYYLGKRNTAEEASELLHEARMRYANGTFHEWFRVLKGK